MMLKKSGGPIIKGKTQPLKEFLKTRQKTSPSVTSRAKEPPGAKGSNEIADQNIILSHL